MSEGPERMRVLTPAELTAVGGGSSSDELLESAAQGAAAGVALGARAGALAMPPLGAVIGAGYGGLVGGFLGGMSYIVGELFDYCF